MKVNCPICNKSIDWNEQATFRPFCSQRCQLIDLGTWSEEAYVIKEVDSYSLCSHLDYDSIID